jgi:hypothetical protein
MPGEAGLQFQFHRPFGLEDLSVAEAGGYWDFRRLGSSLAWRQTAVADIYREQGWEYRQSYRLGGDGAWPGTLDLGGALTGWLLAFPGKTAAGFSQGFGAVWRPVAPLKLGAFADGIPLGGGDFVSAPVYQLGIEALARSGRRAAAAPDAFPAQAVRLDFRKTGGLPWRALASLSLSPHRALQISAGLASPPFQLSLGLKLRWGGCEIVQAYRYHRYLGGTFLSGLGFSRDRAP